MVLFFNICIPQAIMMDTRLAGHGFIFTGASLDDALMTDYLRFSHASLEAWLSVYIFF